MSARGSQNPPRPSDDEAIAATAAAWLAQRDDRLGAEEEAEFRRWRAADPRHEAAVARLEAAWEALHALRDFRPEAQRHPERDLLRPARSRRRRLPRPLRLAALALAAACVVIAAWWGASGLRGLDGTHARYATTTGGYQRVSLEDGSVLELNSDSEAIVRFTAAERRVRLRRGEAHFTVAKNKARPFVVDAFPVAVRAVGTAFNVRLGRADVEVLVTEGRVELARTSGLSSSVPGSPATSAPTLLAANERAVVSTLPAAAARAAPVVESVPPDALREALAWQGARLLFVDTPLAVAIAQFNRRNAVQIELADPALGALPIGGSFRGENVDAFLRLLASGGDIVVERPAPERVVLRKAK